MTDITVVLLSLVMSSTNTFILGSERKAAGSNVLIGHLDYSYVKDCTDVKELEEIISVLRFVVNETALQL